MNDDIDGSLLLPLELARLTVHAADREIRAAPGSHTAHMGRLREATQHLAELLHHMRSSSGSTRPVYAIQNGQNGHHAGNCSGQSKLPAVKLDHQLYPVAPPSWDALQEEKISPWPAANFEAEGPAADEHMFKSFESEDQTENCIACGGLGCGSCRQKESPTMETRNEEACMACDGLGCGNCHSKKKRKDLAVNVDFISMTKGLSSASVGESRQSEDGIIFNSTSSPGPDLSWRVYSKIFDDLDLDHSGLVSAEELRLGLHHCGVSNSNFQRLFKFIDTSRDGTISREEFLIFMGNSEKGSLAEKICHASGQISKNAASVHNNPYFSVGAINAKQYRYMLRQTSVFRMAWDLLVVILLFYISISVPYTIGFAQGGNKEPFASIDSVVDALFIFDLLLNFRTGYFAPDGFEVLEWRRVAKNYIKSWFFLDVFAAAPLDRLDVVQSVFSMDQNAIKLAKTSRVLRVLRVMRIGKLAKMIRILAGQSELGEELWYNINRSRTQVRASLYLILFLCFMLAHWLACLYGVVGGLGFLDEYDEGVGASSVRAYLVCVYWAMTTMTTTGYGDIVPKTDGQRVFYIFAMVIGGAFYGYVLGNMTNIVHGKDMNARLRSERLNEVEAWCERNQVPVRLKRRVVDFFTRYTAKKPPPNEAAILHDLPIEMKNDLSKYLIPMEIRENFVFVDVPSAVVAQVFHISQVVTAERLETVVRPGDDGNAMFIIDSGHAQMEQAHAWSKDSATLYKLPDRQVAKLEQGDSFGAEIILDFQELYVYEVVAEISLSMIMIARDEFKKTMNKWPHILGNMRNTMEEYLAKTSLPKTSSTKGLLSGEAKQLVHLSEGFDRVEKRTAEAEKRLHEKIEQNQTRVRSKESLEVAAAEAKKAANVQFAETNGLPLAANVQFAKTNGLPTPS